MEWSLWTSSAGGSSRQAVTVASTANTMITHCKPTPLSCISLALSLQSQPPTSHSIGDAKGEYHLLSLANPLSLLRQRCTTQRLRLPSYRSMIIAGTSFLIGAVFQASAKNTIALLFIGRVFWGIGKCSVGHLFKTLALSAPAYRLRSCCSVQVSDLATTVPLSTQLRWLHPGA